MSGGIRIPAFLGCMAIVLALPITARPTVAHASACTDTWIGGDGQWGAASSWSAGHVPGPSDDVCITATTRTTPSAAADTYTVGLGGEGTHHVHSLQVGGPNGNQGLVIGGGANYLQVQAASAINLRGFLGLEGSGSAPVGLMGAAGVTLTNAGHIGTIFCECADAGLPPVVDNLSSGVIDFGNPVGAGSINNSGLIVADADNYGDHGQMSLAGALTEAQFRSALSSAGFEAIEIRETHRVHEHAAAAIIRARKARA